MSTLGQAIKEELRSNTGSGALLDPGAGKPVRVFPQVIPQKVPGGAWQVPAVTYERRAVARSVTYCGTIGLVRTTMSLDCYALTYDDAHELASAVRSALIDYKGTLGGIVDVRHASLETEFDVQDFEPGLYRVSQSWNFWHVET